MLNAIHYSFRYYSTIHYSAIDYDKVGICTVYSFAKSVFCQTIQHAYI